MHGGYARGLTPYDDVTFLLTAIYQQRNTANGIITRLITD